MKAPSPEPNADTRSQLLADASLAKNTSTMSSRFTYPMRHVPEANSMLLQCGSDRHVSMHLSSRVLPQLFVISSNPVNR